MGNVRMIGFRANESHETKLREMAVALGTNPSAVLRDLVECAELRPAVKMTAVAVLPVNKNNGGPNVDAETAVVA